MRITTWNVNGLRAIFKKDVWQYILDINPDVICLQEIKAKPEQLDLDHDAHFIGYDIIWNPAERPGYSGVATLTKKTPQKVTLGFGVDEFDREGRVIQTLQEGFMLFNVYFPNGQRDQGRLDYKLDFYEKLLDCCLDLKSQGIPVVICGDFNTAHHEIDLKNPKSNQKTSGFLPEEREWVTRYLDSGFIDAYRHLYPNQIQYTWWTYISNARQRNVGWRLDYFLISEDLLPVLSNSTIHDEIMGSDHCPVSLELVVN